MTLRILFATLVLSTAAMIAACSPTAAAMPEAASTVPANPAQPTSASAAPTAAAAASAPAPGAAAPSAAEAATLQVLAPLDGAVVNTGLVPLLGTASPGAVVTVNDEILIAGSDGSFQTMVSLEEGPNVIEVVASNSTGGETFVNVTVTYEP